MFIFVAISFLLVTVAIFFSAGGSINAPSASALSPLRHNCNCDRSRTFLKIAPAEAQRSISLGVPGLIS